jgi:hypothetical protein
MNNSCKILTSITALMALSVGGMELDPRTRNWMDVQETRGESRESLLVGLLRNGNDGNVGEIMVDLGLFDGVNFEEETAFGTLVQTASNRGSISVLHHAAIAGVPVSADSVVQCLLAFDVSWSDVSHCKTAARLIAKVATQTGVDPSDILAELERQASLNPEQHRDLLRSLQDKTTMVSLERILRNHGNCPF